MALPVLRRRHGRRDGALERWERPTVDRGWAYPRSPWTEFSELHDRMGKLLSELVEQTFGDVYGGGWRPAADVEETEDAYLVEIELPGVKRDDVTVEFGGGELTVSGQVKERERVGFLRTRTRPVGRFDYRVSLPAEIEEEKVTASLSEGVLTVRVPKTERARQRKIPISTG
jgi:HSP20 family protein